MIKDDKGEEDSQFNICRLIARPWVTMEENIAAILVAFIACQRGFTILNSINLKLSVTLKLKSILEPTPTSDSPRPKVMTITYMMHRMDTKVMSRVP